MLDSIVRTFWPNLLYSILNPRLDHSAGSAISYFIIKNSTGFPLILPLLYYVFLFLPFVAHLLHLVGGSPHSTIKPNSPSTHIGPSICPEGPRYLLAFSFSD